MHNELWLESIISSTHVSSTTLKDIQCLYILIAFNFFHFACSDNAQWNPTPNDNGNFVFAFHPIYQSENCRTEDLEWECNCQLFVIFVFVYVLPYSIWKLQSWVRHAKLLCEKNVGKKCSIKSWPQSNWYFTRHFVLWKVKARRLGENILKLCSFVPNHQS